MRHIYIADETLKQTDNKLSFREKVEVVRILDRFRTSVIELPGLQNDNEKIDSVLHKTLANVAHNATLSAAISLTGNDLESAWDAISGAAQKRLSLSVPMSSAQIEFFFHMKPEKLLAAIGERLKAALALCGEVEFVAEDTLRGDSALLRNAIRTAIGAGAKIVTLCDPEGVTLPEEWRIFIEQLQKDIPEISTVRLGLRVCDRNGLGLSCALCAIGAGVDEIKVTCNGSGAPNRAALLGVLEARGSAWGVTHDLLSTETDTGYAGIARLLNNDEKASDSTDSRPLVVSESTEDGQRLDASATPDVVASEIRRLGYVLSDEDNARVYEEFRRITAKLSIGPRELETLVATTAMQVPSTYELVSYVTNSGNTISATAHIRLNKDGVLREAVSIGDGPIDAAFLALEQIVGRHFELDDFRIQAVTEGREAMGSALVKLRDGGTLVAGQGVSTDIIGASIRAYLNAVNKIVYEEARP